VPECYHASYRPKNSGTISAGEKYIVRFDLFSLITAAVPLAGLRHPRVRITSHFYRHQRGFSKDVTPLCAGSINHGPFRSICLSLQRYRTS